MNQAIATGAIPHAHSTDTGGMLSKTPPRAPFLSQLPLPVTTVTRRDQAQVTGASTGVTVYDDLKAEYEELADGFDHK